MSTSEYMSDRPKISVLMPIYNAEKYLAKTLESILKQTFTDFEVIAINDGSTDGSEAILHEFQQRDRRIHVFSQQNAGLIETLNRGLTYIKAEYISRIDADDIALPELFAKQVAFLDSNPDHVAAGGRVLMIDEDDAPIKEANDLLTHEEIDQAHLMGFGTFPHSGSMIRRDAIAKIGGYRKEVPHAEDIDLWLRLAEIGKLQNLPSVAFKYRLHLKSIGHSKRSQQIESTRRLIIDAHLRRGLTPPAIPYGDHSTKETVYDIYTRWAWWALEGKNVATFRKYAWRAFWKRPFSLLSWKLLYAALRGR